jgi:hypothetical protein
VGDATNSGGETRSGLLVARFVRYPGCQQLVVWLPQPGHTGYLELVVHQRDRGVRERAPVVSRLSGSVQILFDTLAGRPVTTVSTCRTRKAGAIRLRFGNGRRGWRSQ